MKKIFLTVLIGMFFIQASYAVETVVDFEDLPPGTPVPPDYAGLNWSTPFTSQVWPIPWPDTGIIGVKSLAPIGMIQFNELVDFKGVAVSAMQGSSCIIFGYREGVANQSKVIDIVNPPELPQFFGSDFTEKVDSIVITCIAPEFILDNVAYERDPTPPAPAPEFGNLAIAALIILLAPAFGLIYTKRRK